MTSKNLVISMLEVSVKDRDDYLMKIVPSEHACYWSICVQEFFHFNLGTELPNVLPMFEGLHISILLT